MPPQTPAPTQVPTGQANPLIRMLLMRRAQQALGGAPGAATAPNALPTPGAAPMPAAAPPNVMRPPQGGANPAQAVMKAAAQAQSPMVADAGTRNLAKQLIMKLMQHM